MPKQQEPKKVNPLFAFNPMTQEEIKQEFAPDGEEQTVKEKESVQPTPPSSHETLVLQVPPEPVQPQVLPGMDGMVATGNQAIELRPPAPNPRFPKGPATIRRRSSDLPPFRQRYTPKTWQIDNRIVEVVDNLVKSSGMNDTVGINRIMMFVLIECGYRLPPDLLADPIYRLEEDAEGR